LSAFDDGAALLIACACEQTARAPKLFNGGEVNHISSKPRARPRDLERSEIFAARNRRFGTGELFREAQRLTRWHYQWIIVHEFLPQIIGQSLVNDILARGRRIYRPAVGFMPVEFQGACYRMGHSMVRPSYRANSPATTAGRYSPSFSILRRKARPTRAICAAACARRGASSAGRRSSTRRR
jgi:Animal haem peroxidase